VNGPGVLLYLRVFLICAVASGLIGLAMYVALDRFKGTTVDVATVHDEPIVVAIDGAVAVPGVYELPANARLNDLVLAAGGLTESADPTNLNLAARIGDGETIHITFALPEAPATNATPASGLVNINTASASELEELPGIGEVLAGRIVAYRERFGPFGSVDQLIEVEGIDEGTVNELRPLVTVGG
jgi:competence protein ComEA